MKKSLYIITGASSGLGLALAKQVLNEGHDVVGLSRSKPALFGIQFIKTDLSKAKELTIKKTIYNNLKKVATARELSNYNKIVLVNNAATIEPIGPVGSLKPQAIDTHIFLNLTAPILLINYFLEIFKLYKGEKLICNISSGAAGFAIPSWSLYCGTKAGINMFTETMSLQFKKSDKIKAICYSPGIMDTPMQGVIRSKSLKEFPDVGRFKGYKKNKELMSSEYVAKHLKDLLKNSTTLVSGQVYEVK